MLYLAVTLVNNPLLAESISQEFFISVNQPARPTSQRAKTFAAQLQAEQGGPEGRSRAEGNRSNALLAFSMRFKQILETNSALLNSKVLLSRFSSGSPVLPVHRLSKRQRAVVPAPCSLHLAPFGPPE